MTTVKSIYCFLTKTFQAHKVQNPQQSSLQILEKVLDKSLTISKDGPSEYVSKHHFKKILNFANRRKMHEPLQYILGDVEFRGMNLQVLRPVPRPDNEANELVELALQMFYQKKGKLHFCEVGSDSGAISLALLSEISHSEGVIVDTSLDTLELAAKNFKNVFGKEEKLESRLELVKGSFNDFSDKNVHKFDLIISDPPIMSTEQWQRNSKEIRLYEDRKANDGGKYGMDSIWEILRNAKDNLKTGGSVIMSVGKEHAEFLREYFKDQAVHQLKISEFKFDSQDNEKYVVFTKVSCSEKVTKQESSATSSEEEELEVQTAKSM